MAKDDTPSLLLDGRGNVRMASASAARLFGSTPGDLEKCRLHDLLDRPDQGAIEAILRRSDLPASGTTRLAGAIRLPAGRLADADLVLSRLPRAEGFRIGGSILVTIRVLDSPADQDPGPEGTRLGVPDTAVASTTNDAVAVCRRSRLVHVDEGFAEMVGMPASELTGWSLKSLVSPEDLLPVVEALGDVESGSGSPGAFGFHLLRAGGLPPLEVSARARRASVDGQPAVLLGLRDISLELRNARSAVERLSRLDAALAAASEGVLILGEPGDWPVLQVSPGIRTLFGVDTSRWAGRPFRDVWPEIRGAHANPDEEERSWLSVLGEPDSLRVDKVRLADPVPRVLERTTSPVRDQEGAVIGRICTFRDVTARLQVEEELMRSREEARRAREDLERLHGDLLLANEGLEMRMAEMQALNRDLKVLAEMKSNLLANVSHELKTPLVSIKGFTELILQGRLGSITEEQKNGLEVALRNIDRLIGLIGNLLEFARSSSSAPLLKLESFPLAGLVGEAFELVRGEAERRGIRMKMTIPQDLVVRADRDKIVQVMLNLLTNGIKYNNDGGRLTVVAATGRRATARVEVQDTGIGIRREDLERIFDRNYRAGNRGEPADGAGIGLAITKDILREHGCMIRAESRPGQGSVFSFTLPLESKPDDPRGDSSQAVVEDLAADRRGGG